MEINSVASQPAYVSAPPVSENAWAWRIEALRTLCASVPDGHIITQLQLAELTGVVSATVNTWAYKKHLALAGNGNNVDAHRTLAIWEAKFACGELRSRTGRRGPESRRDDLTHAESPGPAVTTDAEAPVVPAVRPPAIDTTAVRKRAFAAAKEAYRDVILDEADRAEARGDKDLQIVLLKDYIEMEEKLQVIYKGGRA